mgnify:CR=1 FL=1
MRSQRIEYVKTSLAMFSPTHFLGNIPRDVRKEMGTDEKNLFVLLQNGTLFPLRTPQLGQAIL